MPSLASRSSTDVDLSGYVPVDKPAQPTVSIPSENLEPGFNPYLRCPLPPIWTTPPDTLRQFYHKNSVPQVRLFNPPSTTAGSGGGTTINNVTVSSSSASSGGTTTTTTLSIKQTSLSTPSINQNDKYTGSFTLSKAFQLLTLSASAPCRVQLYTTANIQSSDSYRGLDVPPPAGSAQGIICDVALDTAPLLWNFQDRVGANGDSPNTSTIYITVTNLDTISESFTITFSYVPLVT